MEVFLGSIWLKLEFASSMSNHRNQSSTLFCLFLRVRQSLYQSQALQSLSKQVRHSQELLLSFSDWKPTRNSPTRILYMRLARKVSLLYPDCEFNRFSLVRGHPVGISWRRIAYSEEVSDALKPCPFWVESLDPQSLKLCSAIPWRLTWDQFILEEVSEGSKEAKAARW